MLRIFCAACTMCFDMCRWRLWRYCGVERVVIVVLKVLKLMVKWEFIRRWSSGFLHSECRNPCSVVSARRCPCRCWQFASWLWQTVCSSTNSTSLWQAVCSSYQLGSSVDPRTSPKFKTMFMPIFITQLQISGDPFTPPKFDPYISLSSSNHCSSLFITQVQRSPGPFLSPKLKALLLHFCHPSSNHCSSNPFYYPISKLCKHSWSLYITQVENTVHPFIS